MATPSVHDSPTHLALVNRVLTAGGLPPVTALDSSIANQDAYHAWNVILSVAVPALAKGWWFNTEERRETFTDIPEDPADKITEVIPGIYRATPSPRRISDPMQAETYEIVGTPGAASASLRVYGDTGPARQPLFDVVKLIELDDCPVEFHDYVVWRSARLFHRTLGVNLPADEERDAMDLLVRLQAQHDNEQCYNTVNNSSTLLTWLR